MKPASQLKINAEELLALYHYLKTFDSSLLPISKLKYLIEVDLCNSSIIIEDIEVQILLDHLTPGLYTFTASIHSKFTKGEGYKEFNTTNTPETGIFTELYNNTILIKSMQEDFSKGSDTFINMFYFFYKEIKQFISTIDPSLTMSISVKDFKTLSQSSDNTSLSIPDRVLKVPPSLKRVYQRGQTIKFCQKPVLEITFPEIIKPENRSNKSKKQPAALQRILNNVR